MVHPRTKDDVEQLIINQVQESLHFDYKASDSGVAPSHCLL
jgi:hypothetical protein